MNNKREYYRLDLFGEIEVSISHLSGDAKGRILDISASGMAFESNKNLDLKTVTLSFSLNDTHFTRDAFLIRKKEQIPGNYFYAVNFFSFTEKERQALFQSLLRIDAERRREENEDEEE